MVIGDEAAAQTPAPMPDDFKAAPALRYTPAQLLALRDSPLIVNCLEDFPSAEVFRLRETEVKENARTRRVSGRASDAPATASGKDRRERATQRERQGGESENVSTSRKWERSPTRSRAEDANRKGGASKTSAASDVNPRNRRDWGALGDRRRNPDHQEEEKLPEWMDEMDSKNDETFGAAGPIEEFDFQARDFDPIASFKAQMKAKNRLSGSNRNSAPNSADSDVDPIAAFKRMMKEAQDKDHDETGTQSKRHTIEVDIPQMQQDKYSPTAERAAPITSRFAGRLFAAESDNAPGQPPPIKTGPSVSSQQQPGSAHSTTQSDRVPSPRSSVYASSGPASSLVSPTETRQQQTTHLSQQQIPERRPSPPNVTRDEQEHFNFIMNKLSGMTVQSQSPTVHHAQSAQAQHISSAHAHAAQRETYPTQPEQYHPRVTQNIHIHPQHYSQHQQYLQMHQQLAAQAPPPAVTQHPMQAYGGHYQATDAQLYAAAAAERERAKKKTSVLIGGNVPTAVARHLATNARLQQQQQQQSAPQPAQAHMRAPPQSRPMHMDPQSLAREQAHINIMQQLNRDRVQQTAPVQYAHPAHAQALHHHHAAAAAQYHPALVAQHYAAAQQHQGIRPRAPPPPGAVHGDSNAAILYHLQQQQQQQLARAQAPPPHAMAQHHHQHQMAPTAHPAYAQRPQMQSYQQHHAQAAAYHIQQQQLQHMMAGARPPRDMQ